MCVLSGFVFLAPGLRPVGEAKPGEREGLEEDVAGWGVRAEIKPRFSLTHKKNCL